MLNYYKSKIFFTILFFVGIIGCANENTEVKKLSFNSKLYSFEKIFQKVQDYTIPTVLNDSIKIFGINKIVEYNNSFLISDSRSHTLFLVSKRGKLEKIFGRKGKGPGDFIFLSDFIVTHDRKVLAIDALTNTLNVFQKKKFINKVRLSFVHRFPEQILECKDDKFIICASRNLKDGSSKENFRFLPYKQKCYLNLYDKDFNLNVSFVNPHPLYNKSMDVFAVPLMNTFSPSVVIGDKIYTMRQDGFYEIIVSNCKGKRITKYLVYQPHFVKFDLNSIQDHRVSGYNSNYSQEKQGQIIAGHSSPVSLHAIDKYLFITIVAPFDNAFEQYSTTEWAERKYHLDIYRVEKDELKTVVGGIVMNKKIVGITQDNAILCIDNKYEENIKEIRISKYRMKL